ncbi:hypothetical protein AB0A81_31345 [Streptomyces flaveolus]|uniref:SAM-dependent methyltransferase n=1 Tax=Streptomyces flaveolus TaxID=67297 RepID=A0ABV1VJD3_9ACTN
MHRGGAVTVHLSPQAGSAWDDEAQVLTRLGEEVPLVQNSLVDEPTFEDALLDRAPHRAASRARGTPLLWAIRVKR